MNTKDMLGLAAVLGGLCGCGGDTSTGQTSGSNKLGMIENPVFTNPLRVVAGTSYFAKDAGYNPRWVVNDFNADGYKDIFLRYDPESAFSDTITGTAPVYFFVGSAQGGFTDATKSLLPTGYSPTLVNRIVVTDFNSDNKPDILIATSGQDPYKNGKGLGTGHTGEKSQILTYTNNGYVLSDMGDIPNIFAHHASFGDINNDGNIDALITSVLFDDSFFVMGSKDGKYIIDTNRITEGATISYLANVTSTFANGFPKTWESTIYSASAMVDANNDGNIDIVMFASSGTKSNIVFFNDGKGNFSSSNSSTFDNGVPSYNYLLAPKWENTYNTGTTYIDTVVVDVNGDGRKDIISLSTFNDQTEKNYIYYRGSKIEVWINNGHGFEIDNTRIAFDYYPAQNFTAYDTIEASDINNDGFLDVLIHRGQSNVDPEHNFTKIFLNNGSGSFKEVQYPVNVPKGILTVLGPGHYAVLVSERDQTTGHYTQRVDDVYFDWKSGVDFFTGVKTTKVSAVIEATQPTDYADALAAINFTTTAWDLPDASYYTFA